LALQEAQLGIPVHIVGKQTPIGLKTYPGLHFPQKLL
jgi:hypothetical protein